MVKSKFDVLRHFKVDPVKIDETVYKQAESHLIGIKSKKKGNTL